MSFHENIRSFLDETIRACNLQLYGFEMGHNGPNKKLSVFIENKTPITSDDCTLVAKQLRIASAVHLPMLSNMDLEVSSPGVERVLYTLEHCKKHTGKRVKVRIRTPHENQRNFVARLHSVDQDNQCIQIEDHDQTFTLAWNNVDRIRILFEETR